MELNTVLNRHLPIDKFDSLYRVEVNSDDVIRASAYLRHRLGMPYDVMEDAAEWGAYWKYAVDATGFGPIRKTTAIYWFYSRDEAILFRLSI